MKRFQTVHYRVRAHSPEKRPDKAFCALVLSDLHNCCLGKNNRDLIREIRTLQPDLILCVGDLITKGRSDSRHSFAHMDHALDLMAAIAGDFPVYASNGNHEQRLKQENSGGDGGWDYYRKRMEERGVHILDNECVSLTLHGMPLDIRGLDLPAKCYRRGRSMPLGTEEIEERVGKADPARFQLLLAHHPGYFPEYAKWGANLTLAGHYHGGIVRLPLLGAVISPQMQFFPRYSHGLFSIEHKDLITSSGLGWHTIPIRVNNPPELIALHFVP